MRGPHDAPKLAIETITVREGHLHIEAPGAYAQDRGRIEAGRVASAEICDRCGAKRDPIEDPTTGKQGTRCRVCRSIDTLENALEQLGFHPIRDLLFSVGDLIDRGPRSEATLEWIASRRMHAVRANHEQTMVKALTLEPGRLFKSGASGQWLDNAGGWWFGFEGLDETGWPVWRESPHPKRAGKWLAALRTVPCLRTIETPAGRVGIVHTGTDLYEDWKELDAGMRVQEQRARDRSGL